MADWWTDLFPAGYGCALESQRNEEKFPKDNLLEEVISDAEYDELETEEEKLMQKLWRESSQKVPFFISEHHKTCRICYKSITNKESGKWMYFTDNTPTMFGKYYEIIIEQPIDYSENVSKRACNVCAKKLKNCFSALIDIRISDTVLRRVSSETNGQDKKINVKTLMFECETCKLKCSGLTNFIKHYKYHLLNKKRSVNETNDQVVDMNYDNSNDSTGSYVNNQFETVEATKKQNRTKITKPKTNHELEFVDLTDFTEAERKIVLDDFLEDSIDTVSLNNDDDFIKIIEEELKNNSDVDNDEVFNDKTIIFKDDFYYCPIDICSEKFQYKFLLRNHLAYHEAHKVINVNKQTKRSTELSACRYCLELFTRSELRTHNPVCKINFGLDRTFLCNFCGQTFFGFNAWKNHRSVHLKSRAAGILQCNVCSKVFCRRSTLLNHAKTHDENKKVICDVCGIKMLPMSMWKHKFIHTGKLHKCVLCSHAYSHRYLLEEHLFRHKEPYDDTVVKPCTRCDETFNILDDLLNHLTEVHNIKTAIKHAFPCKYCKELCAGPRCLRFHFLQKHRLTQVEYYCNLCDKDFPDVPTIRSHFNQAHEKAEFDLKAIMDGMKRRPTRRYLMKCNYCNYTARRARLKIHVKNKHMIEDDDLNTRVECDECKNTFASRASLSAHVKTVHLKLKPIECNECGRTFSKNTSYLYHLQTHTGDKFFQCEVCRRSFRQRCDVIRHLVRHVREGDVALADASCVNNYPSDKVKKKRLLLSESKDGRRLLDLTSNDIQDS